MMRKCACLCSHRRVFSTEAMFDLTSTDVN